ncbi:hypothetical protein, partial [Streptomyces sp. NPDC005969]|uniref:hypothetical protein n=1 Tax=Streptomyces sp. NPDC005969 TaxID=3156722 RepID=UPI0034060BD7
AEDLIGVVADSTLLDAGVGGGVPVDDNVRGGLEGQSKRGVQVEAVVGQPVFAQRRMPAPVWAERLSRMM